MRLELLYHHHDKPSTWAAVAHPEFVAAEVGVVAAHLSQLLPLSASTWVRQVAMNDLLCLVLQMPSLFLLLLPSNIREFESGFDMYSRTGILKYNMKRI